MKSLHLSDLRSAQPWHGGAIAIVAAVLALTVLLLAVGRQGPIRTISVTSATSETQPSTALVGSAALPFDVSSRVLPDELPPPAEPANGNGQRP